MFYNQIVSFYWKELLEIELLICIKMHLALKKPAKVDMP